MPDGSRPLVLRDMAAQRPAAPDGPAEARARFFNSGNAFNIVLPPVPDTSFTEEPARALDPSSPTGLIACDASAALDCDYPATTPFVLARYARIRAGEPLNVNFDASGVLHYVIAGNGSTSCAGEAFDWAAGDVFVLPGGVEHRHKAADADAVLWLVSNEPLLEFEHLRAPEPHRAPTPAVHYPAAEIAGQIERIYGAMAAGDDDTGRALIFSSDRQEAGRNVLPSLTLAMNTLPAGASQRAHRHNSVAVSLIVQGEGCHSMIDGRRKDWRPWATTVTPPGAVHSHHNDGERRALFLIVQDGGLYYQARAMGFALA